MTKLLTAAEVADRIRLSQTTLWRHAREGTIPTVRIGRSIRFDPAAVDRWLERQSTGPTE